MAAPGSSCSPNCLLLGHGRCVLRCGCSLLSIGVQRISLLALRSQNRRCSMGKLIQRPVGSSSSKLRVDAQRAQRTGGGGPRSTSRGSASNAPTCTAGSVGRLCAARMSSCSPRRSLEARFIFAEPFLDNCFYVGSRGATEKRQGEHFNKIHPAIVVDVIVQTIILGIPQHRRQVSRQRQ